MRRPCLIVHNRDSGSMRTCSQGDISHHEAYALRRGQGSRKCGEILQCEIRTAAYRDAVYSQSSTAHIVDVELAVICSIHQHLTEVMAGRGNTDLGIRSCWYDEECRLRELTGQSCTSSRRISRIIRCTVRINMQCAVCSHRLTFEIIR